ncbi:MAG TPA: 50S ribosomal protein L15 [Candidatus Uhrbacteria bacterium]|nr:50S ribosomal protein L15 [Candidatus Uhrbacteria bacterium]
MTALKLYNLKPAKGAKKRKKRVGRGNASGHGTYATRGLKGQRSRSGGKGGLKLKGLKANIQSIPKLGGFKSLKPKLAVVNLKDLEKNFSDNEIVTAAKLKSKSLIKSIRPGVKVLGMGKLDKKLILKVDKISESAREAVEKAGGKIILLSFPKETKKEESGKIKEKEA